MKKLYGQSRSEIEILYFLDYYDQIRDEKRQETYTEYSNQNSHSNQNFCVLNERKLNYSCFVHTIDCFISTELLFQEFQYKDHLLFIQCNCRKKPKLNYRHHYCSSQIMRGPFISHPLLLK